MRKSLKPQKGFTLIELLVVMSIVILIASLAAPSVGNVIQSSQLRQASDQITGTLSLARQSAIANNCQIEVRFYQYSPGISGSATAKFQSFQLFQISDNGQAIPLGKVQLLPASVIMDSNGNLSPLLTLSQLNQTYSLPTVGTNYKWAAFRFRPDGSTNLSSTSNAYWCLTLHSSKSGDNLTLPPPNYSTIQIDPLSGSLTIYRPSPMRAIDWFIMIAPMAGILAVAFYTRKYMRGVADFMAGGRAAGRYLLCTAKAEQGAGAVMFVGLFEVFAQSGFTTNWWQQLTVPVGLVISITGFVYYRYRQTRALTLAQFFEMRYSRRFRIFTGALGFLAGICNFGIIPCIGARFFVYFLDLPQSLNLFATAIPTYLVLMACFLTTSTLLTLSGGQVTILVINTLEGIFSQIGFVIVALALMVIFKWDTIHEVLLNQPAGHSLVNPFDSFP